MRCVGSASVCAAIVRIAHATFAQSNAPAPLPPVDLSVSVVENDPSVSIRSTAGMLAGRRYLTGATLSVAKRPPTGPKNR